MNIDIKNFSEVFLGSETLAALGRMLRMAVGDEDYKRRVREYEVSYGKAVYDAFDTPRERQERDGGEPRGHVVSITREERDGY